MNAGRWLVLTVRVPSEELTDELTEGLLALGGTAVEERGGALTTYLPEPSDPDAFRRTAADRLARVTPAPELEWSWQEDQDWSRRWKDGLAPKRVGRRLVVTQPWNPVDAGPDDLVIEIDPSTAFGTGEHATTRGALRLMEAFIGGGEAVLDVGTGSAILAIAAVRLGVERVLAVESDDGSMETARENLERNGVEERVELVHGLVDPDFLARAGGPGFDLIVANVLSGVLVPLLPAFAAALRTGRGAGLILGGILATEAPAVRAAAERAGFGLEGEDREGEWWTGLFRRGRP